MPVLMDHAPAKFQLAPHSTLADILDWAQLQLPPDRVIVKVQLDDDLLEGPALAEARLSPLGQRTLRIATHSRKDLALTTIGKLAALIEWLAPQHKEIARLLEQGNSSTALSRFAQILSAWQQIQAAYGNLARLLGITMKDLPVRDLGPGGGEIALNEFCNHLSEMRTALQNHDLVLLADILQYEMDGAVANWMALLESTLAIVEPSAAAA